ncbi:MAG: C40 family peptidase, partial [Novosphingobium sp.]|nr:C40 family peptidase [Novosphingobium sp.]
FRLHGREPATGLDCVGLVHAALMRVGGRPVPPRGYGLRNLAIGQWLPLAEQSGLTPASEPIRSGDVLLVELGFAQHHLVIACGAASFIHAHAGLRQVVCQPRDPAWQFRAAWRLAPPLSES